MYETVGRPMTQDFLGGQNIKKMLQTGLLNLTVI